MNKWPDIQKHLEESEGDVLECISSSLVAEMTKQQVNYGQPVPDIKLLNLQPPSTRRNATPYAHRRQLTGQFTTDWT